jgi:N6-adenosine-specific RNA methylase IME4
MAGRPRRKSGAYTRAEIQRRYRRRKKQAQRDPGTVRKQERRAEREYELAARTIASAQALGVDGKRYGVILADPPWRFEPYSRETGMDRAADNHYPTMMLAAIQALHLPAADDCVLYLWATAAMLPEALDAIAAWGFTYKSLHGWAKPGLGTGYWVRDNLELLLIATRGQPVAPAPGQQSPSLIEAARGRHSEKPDVFVAMIERLYPSTPKLEMFARQPRAGWDVWGNEVEGEDATAPEATDPRP